MQKILTLNINHKEIPVHEILIYYFTLYVKICLCYCCVCSHWNWNAAFLLIHTRLDIISTEDLILCFCWIWSEVFCFYYSKHTMFLQICFWGERWGNKTKAALFNTGDMSTLFPWIKKKQTRKLLWNGKGETLQTESYLAKLPHVLISFSEPIHSVMWLSPSFMWGNGKHNTKTSALTLFFSVEWTVAEKLMYILRSHKQSISQTEQLLKNRLSNSVLFGIENQILEILETCF